MIKVTSYVRVSPLWYRQSFRVLQCSVVLACRGFKYDNIHVHCATDNISAMGFCILLNHENVKLRVIPLHYALQLLWHNH